MAKKQFDVRMQVLLCPKHKKVFEEEVKVPIIQEVIKEKYDISPKKLCDLWDEAELCSDCKWKTTFGKT